MIIEHIINILIFLYFNLTLLLLYYYSKKIYLSNIFTSFLFIINLCMTSLCILSNIVLFNNRINHLIIFNIENISGLFFILFFNKRGINYYEKNKEKHNDIISWINLILFVEFFIYISYIVFINIYFSKIVFNIKDWPYYILHSFIINHFIFGIIIIKINYNNFIRNQHLICLLVTIPGFVFFLIIDKFNIIKNPYYIKYSWIIFSSFLTHFFCIVLPLINIIKNKKNQNSNDKEIFNIDLKNISKNIENNNNKNEMYINLYKNILNNKN